MSGYDHYKAGTAEVNLIGYETASFFEDDCDIEFTGQFDDEAGTCNDQTVYVTSGCVRINVTSMLSEDKIEDYYRKAMSVRGK